MPIASILSIARGDTIYCGSILSISSTRFSLVIARSSLSTITTIAVGGGALAASDAAGGLGTDRYGFPSSFDQVHAEFRGPEVKINIRR
jgi:hypothetical protein